MSSVIYFNNAATTFPKPYCVTSRIIRALDIPPIDSMRVCNCKKNNDDLDLLCKDAVSKFFNLQNNYEVILTPGATYSSNIILNHFSKLGYNIAYTTKQEHNSIYRTLNALNYKIKYLPFDTNNQLIFDELDDPFADYSKSIVVINHECNVDGNLVDISLASEYCQKIGCPLVIDITQSAGTQDIDISKLKYNNIYFVCSAHKGLFSIPGFGFLIKPKESDIRPLIFGSTGSNSADSINTDSLEVGSQNYLGIISLTEGIAYLRREGLDFIRSKKTELCNYYFDKIKKMSCYDLYTKMFHCDQNLCNKDSGIVSLKVNTLLANEFVNRLKTNDIIIRHGLHCSPIYHLSVLGCKSTIRLSFGVFNTFPEIDRYIKIVDTLLIQSYKYYKSSVIC